ncbi:MAG: SIR2 family protein [Caulobacterales bacterium]|nr:SIR2 family protein [Caulobacterales bacterium]
MKELMARIASGDTLLFAGSGLTAECTNIDGGKLPDAKTLSKDICKLGMFDEDEDLRFASDFFLERNSPSELVDFLTKKFTVVKTSEALDRIMNISWLRIYTTNYDNGIELSARNNGKIIEPITMDATTKELLPKKDVCLHINGFIEKLSKDTLQNSFKLSHSSYISADSFVNSEWNYIFKRDLERCKGIVFIGYSLYDIEIQKILFENPEFHNKTYFITREDIDEKSAYLFSKFGKAIRIGRDNFAEQLQFSVMQNDDKRYALSAFQRYTVSNDEKEIRDLDIDRMLMSGHVSQEYVDTAVLGNPSKPILIKRHCLDSILSFSKSNRHIIVISEFGNGKSIVLNEIKPVLETNGIEVYEIADSMGDFVSDIDFIVSQKKRSVIILENYDEYLEVLRYVSDLKPENLCLIVSARTGSHEKHKTKLEELNFIANEINVDIMTDDEISYFIRMVDNLGLWGDLASEDSRKKIEVVRNDNKSQVSLNLLGLLKSPQIKERIRNAVGPLLDKSEFKDTIFAICFLTSLGIIPDCSLVSEVAQNNEVFSNNLRNNDNFRQLFKMERNKVLSRSAPFCLTLLREQFSPIYIITQLQKIAKLYSNRTFRDVRQNKIFKATLRFSSVETILPSENKRNYLQRHYEELKISVPWLIHDPHYWLQYGMSQIIFRDYNKAQVYFDNAYSFAHKKRSYHTNNIDTQQARLFFLQAIDSVENNKIFDFFKSGHNLLLGISNDFYKFKQFEYYSDFFKSKFNSLSKGNKKHFKNMVYEAKKVVESYINQGEPTYAESSLLARAENDLIGIMDSIVANHE